MNLFIKFVKLDFLEGEAEVGIEEGLGIGNREDLNDFGKDGEEEDLGFCKKILDNSSTRDCM